MANPVFTINLSGNGAVKQLNRTITWSPDTQIENVIKLRSTDGQKTIDISSIDTVKLMIFSCESASFILEFTVDTNVIQHETDLFVLTPTDSFIQTVDSIKLSTSSTSDIEVNVQIFGRD